MCHRSICQFLRLCLASERTRHTVASGFLVASWLGIACCASASADDSKDASLADVRDLYEAGKYEQALEFAGALREDDSLTASEQRVATQYAAACHHAIGDNYFRAGKMAECLKSYDAELALRPQASPQHWQRGIALYYAGRYQDGVDQFELHQTVNSQDVENAVWHLLCAVRTPEGSLAKARASFIEINRDSRVPMAEIHKMFAGDVPPDAVLASAEAAGTLGAAFYADLYVGLFYEAIGDAAASAKYIAKAADNPSARKHFMGDVARVHRLIRTKNVQF